jgi:hypothetical protein
VRVLDVGTLSSGGESTAGELILALPPQQAQVLVAAQGKAQLTLALRRPVTVPLIREWMQGEIGLDGGAGDRRPG